MGMCLIEETIKATDTALIYVFTQFRPSQWFIKIMVSQNSKIDCEKHNQNPSCYIGSIYKNTCYQVEVYL